MSYDDFDRYDGDPVHDMWVDYTTHEYESGESLNIQSSSGNSESVRSQKRKGDYDGCNDCIRELRIKIKKNLNRIQSYEGVVKSTNDEIRKQKYLFKIIKCREQNKQYELEIETRSHKLPALKKKRNLRIIIIISLISLAIIGIILFFAIPSKKERLRSLIDSQYYYPNYGQVTDFFTGEPTKGAFYMAIVGPHDNNPLTDREIWRLAQKVSYLDYEIYYKECDVANYLANRYPVDYVPMEERYPVARMKEEEIEQLRNERQMLLTNIKQRYENNFQPQDVMLILNYFHFTSSKPVTRNFYYVSNDADSIIAVLPTSDYSNPIRIVSEATGVQFEYDLIYENMADHVTHWN